MGKAGENDLGTPSHAPQRGRGIATQFPRVARDQIADLVLLEVSPQILGGIEFRRVGWQGGDLQTPLSGRDELFDQLAAMNGRSIPKDQEWGLQMAQECFQELNDLRTLDGARMDLEIEVPESYSRNDRKTLPAEGLLEHRGLAARCPGAHPVRTCAQATFVEEDDGAPFPGGFFFRFGQT